MENEALIEYFEALERLKKGTPRILSRGTKITNDAVSLEAGRKKGSIKKSREPFRELILAIELASTEQLNDKNQTKDKLVKVRNDLKSLREQLDDSLAREVSLLLELYEAKKLLSKFTGAEIIPIRSSNKND